MQSLIGDNERLKLLAEAHSPLALQGPSPGKDKLIYQLGGRDGAEAAVAFIEAHAQNRDQKARLISELQELKARSVTALLIAEDKTAKL